MAYDAITNVFTITSDLPNFRVRVSIRDQFRDSVTPAVLNFVRILAMLFTEEAAHLKYPY